MQKTNFDKPMTLEELQEAVKRISNNLDTVLMQISVDVTRMEKKLKLHDEFIDSLNKERLPKA